MFLPAPLPIALNQLEYQYVQTLAAKEGLAASAYIRKLLNLPNRPQGRPTIKEKNEAIRAGYKLCEELGLDPVKTCGPILVEKQIEKGKPGRKKKPTYYDLPPTEKQLDQWRKNKEMNWAQSLMDQREGRTVPRFEPLPTNMEEQRDYDIRNRVRR